MSFTECTIGRMLAPSSVIVEARTSRRPSRSPSVVEQRDDPSAHIGLHRSDRSVGVA